LLYLRIESPVIPHSMAIKVHGCSLSVWCKFKGVQRLATGVDPGFLEGELTQAGNLHGGDVLTVVKHARTRGQGACLPNKNRC